ncbi:RNA 2',3'-cyclic phosphodiesterase [Ancylobacter lacus]|uniref:RNA 2',3'-cyclic phosphodiesterase n=1 Tax=Ancylobacter lacus TaxID=2579970 RepID=UPI001BCC0213|nr:RNA 2',3'-cyclic phosphodiesterase [Ancylobacter lacus]MBS7541133.1 RNA 2',3'-cyclic phosphodiesterase [Ancylobacter lacus]
MPRLFTALEIPRDIAGTLSMLRGGIPGARWIDPEFYHVTLRFIGDVDHVVARDVAAALDEVERFGFELTLDGVDQFGNHKPRAIFAAVKANPALTELQAEQERLMKRVGLPPEGRNFRPHVTLARLRNTPPRQVADYLAVRGYFRSPTFEVPRFVLFSSRDSVGGGPYTVEASYPLM